MHGLPGSHMHQLLQTWMLPAAYIVQPTLPGCMASPSENASGQLDSLKCIWTRLVKLGLLGQPQWPVPKMDMGMEKASL